ncbi:MAG TPA: alpha-amylase family glycosyl hydrolase [Candidatus Limnocylindrales bacterium]|nr:alpha-amylase family glycosyl hydrolase [Candidatus Limnocylindrales bacterium]
MEHKQPRWWQTGVVYEIYPRSFADANGDGTGDLAGITSRLDYLAWLGVDALWIAPFYPSPMADFGYDVSDYTAVDPLFGSLDDFDELLAAAHERGVRVLVDYVPNHTSDRHPWFTEARASRDSSKRDWYVWRDAKPDGSPPNNWISMFAGPAWEWDPATDQYYLHTFLSEQPDLNWRNPGTRAAMFDVARFWLDRGVDGFRIDVAPMVMKDPELRDNPPNPDPSEWSRLGAWAEQLHLHDHAHDDMHELYRDFRRLLESYPGDRVSIGELHHPDFDTWAKYYGERQDEIHVPFNFHMTYAPWTADAVRGAIEGVQGVLPTGAWASWVLGNHDQPRFASPHRAGREQAKVGMLLLLTLRGTPTIYYGEEIGMVDVPVAAADSRDPVERREPGRGRDPERSPMQWDASPNAGFTVPDATPWLPLAPDADRVNVAGQAEDPDSILTLTRRLIQLRREHPVLQLGDFEPFGPTPDGTYAFRRVSPGGRLTVALNQTGERHSVPAAGPGRVLIGTDRERDGASVAADVALGPNEAVVIEEAGGA